MLSWWSEQAPCSAQGSAPGTHKQEVRLSSEVSPCKRHAGAPGMGWEPGHGLAGSHSSGAN